MYNTEFGVAYVPGMPFVTLTAMSHLAAGQSLWVTYVNNAAAGWVVATLTAARVAVY
jgi:hypothetical protein